MPTGELALIRTPSVTFIYANGVKGYSIITSGADGSETSWSHKTPLKSLCLEIGKRGEFIIIVPQLPKKESKNEWRSPFPLQLIDLPFSLFLCRHSKSKLETEVHTRWFSVVTFIFPKRRRSSPFKTTELLYSCLKFKRHWKLQHKLNITGVVRTTLSQK